MRNFFQLTVVLIMAIFLSGCFGKRVEIGASEIGRVVTPNGYEDRIITTSTFRLPHCSFPGQICQNLVTASVADISVQEAFELFMPKDRLQMNFVVGATLGINQAKAHMLFDQVVPTATNDDRIKAIPIAKVYNLYAKRVIASESRSFFSQFEIMEIAGNRDAILAQFHKHLADRIEEATPFKVRYVGLDNVDFPKIIVAAQQKAAERREAIAHEEAQLEVSRARFERELEEARLQRAVDVEKAEAEARVNNILADSMTDAYRTYRLLGSLDKISQSDNTKFVPVEMLSSMAGQVLLGNTK